MQRVVACKQGSFLVCERMYPVVAVYQRRCHEYREEGRMDGKHAAPLSSHEAVVHAPAAAVEPAQCLSQEQAED